MARPAAQEPAKAKSLKEVSPGFDLDKPAGKLVSVVIPSYNGRHLLKDHLPSVLASMRNNDELVIVDDASSDDTIDWLRKPFELRSPLKNADTQGEFELYAGTWQKKALCLKAGKNQTNSLLSGRVTVIKNLENLRFAGSCNRGVKQANNPLIFLLNNDVMPTSLVLDRLLPHLSDPDVFAVSCLELEPEKQYKRSGKNKLWFEKGLFHHSWADDFETGKTAWASGGSAMFDRAKWLQLDGFDLDYYPAYWEDIDLSFRARHQHNWQVWFEAGAKVYHNHETTHQTALGRKKMREISWQNADKFTWKNSNLRQKILYLAWRPYWWWRRSRVKKNELNN